jgi:hypothetical protein
LQVATKKGNENLIAACSKRIRKENKGEERKKKRK